MPDNASWVDDASKDMDNKHNVDNSMFSNRAGSKNMLYGYQVHNTSRQRDHNKSGLIGDEVYNGNDIQYQDRHLPDTHLRNIFPHHNVHPDALIQIVYNNHLKEFA